MRLAGTRCAEAVGDPRARRNVALGVIQHLWRSPVPFVGFYPPEGVRVTQSRRYVPMKLRAGLFPIVNFAGQLWFPLFFLAIITGLATPMGHLFVELAVIAFAGVLAFHVVTLPVEINASTRAYGILTRYGILSRGEADGTKRVLTAAAFTYIAAALTSLLTLLYLVLLSRQ